MRRLLTGLAACLLVQSPGAPARAQLAHGQAEAVDRFLAGRIAPDGPGCVVGIARAGSLVHWRGYGLADVEEARRFTPRSAFATGSIFKHFYSAGMLLLAREGKLSLDDDIRKHLPEFPDYGATVSIRQLLDHTHGLREYPDLRLLAAADAGSGDEGALRLLMRQRAPAARPGERFRYGSTGPLLAGLIIERAAGEPTPRFIARSLFEPLRMRGTALGEDGRPVPPRGANYVIGPEGRRIRRPPSPGFRTTIEDLSLWNGHFGTREGAWRSVLRDLTTPARLSNGTKLDYGLGLRLSPYRGLRRVWAPGGSAGARAMFMRFPDSDLAILLGCNHEINPISLAEGVADIVLAREIARSSKPPNSGRTLLTEAQRRAVAGTYVSASGRVVHVVPRAEGLRLLFEGQDHELTPVGPRRFTVAGQPDIPRDPVTEIVFTPGTRSAAPTLDIHTNWYPVSLSRVEPVDPAFVVAADYVGIYSSDEVGSELHVAERDGRLLVRMPQGEHGLEPVARDLFSAGPQTIAFTREGGRVAAALVSLGGVRIAFRRQPR